MNPLMLFIAVVVILVVLRIVHETTRYERVVHREHEEFCTSVREMAARSRVPSLVDEIGDEVDVTVYRFPRDAGDRAA